MLKNDTQKLEEKLFPDRYIEPYILRISPDQWCKVLNNLFLLYANFEGYENIVK